jgi:hypothetical protein
VSNESERLQRLVTAEFSKGMLVPDRDAYTSGQALFDYGQWLESVTWFSIGAEIGFFEWQSAEEAVKLLWQQKAPPLPIAWPSWFRQQKIFGENLVYTGTWPAYRREPRFVTERLDSNQPAALAIFQAALLLSREFRDPCCLNLQRALQSDELFPNDFFNHVGGAEILAVLRGDDQDRPEGPANLIAGFLQLIDLLAAFEAVFPPVGEYGIGIERSPRSVLAKLIGNLLAWRVNLRDRGTNEKLAIIKDVFVALCGEVIEVNQWFPDTSRRKLEQLLENWRDRSDPDINLVGELPLEPGPSTGNLSEPEDLKA